MKNSKSYECSWRGSNPRPLAGNQCSSTELQKRVVFTNTCCAEANWGGGELEGLLFGANIALACKRGFARIEVGRNSLALLLINLVHFGWKLMTEADKCVRISVSNFISEPSHNCFNVRWTRISINSLRIDCPFPFDVPEVIPFCPEKEIMFILISP